jgi:MoaA/NifB/PqqE/SkfB family radical SAM enzyme
MGRRSPRQFAEPPEGPVGAKLELTYACNLRCGFCYTDSPRQTLQRRAELSDEEWRRIADETIEAGVVEAVVSGGEPLLRRDLTLDLVDRFAQAGIGTTLNTNGWFVDADVASRLGAHGGVTAHVSIDGPRPGLHDASRGVPGSWRRAVDAIDHLLSRGVGVCVVHVVTPDNAAELPDTLEQMLRLGVTWMRVTSVVETGAAARGGSWRTDGEATQRVVRDFEERHPNAMRIRLSGTVSALGLTGLAAPASFLVRPNGDVRTDSLRPFTFGNAARDGVDDCWRRIRSDWRDERIAAWAASLRSGRDLANSEVVAYLDDEVPVGAGADGEATRGEDPRTAPVPAPAPLRARPPEEDRRESHRRISGLAARRTYRLARVRVNDGEGARIVRRVGDGRYIRLNSSGGTVLDALDGGSEEDAARALLQRFGIPTERAMADAAHATRTLLRHGVIVPEGAALDARPSEPGTSDLPGEEPDGARAASL